MILKIHVPGALPYDVGDEIWQQPLDEVIAAEAETIAGDASSDLLESPDPAHRSHLREQIVAEMTNALVHIGDSYRAPDGVLYSLIDEPAVDDRRRQDTIDHVPGDTSPIIEEVLRFEELPLGSLGTRRAIMRWSDGSEGDALNW